MINEQTHFSENLFNQLLIQRDFKRLIRVNNVKILIMKIDDKMKTIVDYVIVFLFKSIVIIDIIRKENLILQHVSKSN